jgi:hypothetical protein
MVAMVLESLAILKRGYMDSEDVEDWPVEEGIGFHDMTGIFHLRNFARRRIR